MLKISRIKRYFRKQLTIFKSDRFHKVNPDYFWNKGKKLLIPSFHRAIREQKAYRVLLEKHRVFPSQIKTEEDFNNILPYTDGRMFSEYPTDFFYDETRYDEVNWFAISGGNSGRTKFSFGDLEFTRNAADYYDFAFECLFGASRYRTLVINGLGMGIKVHTWHSFADTSVREDMIVDIVERFGKFYELIIIASETNFFKHVVETGKARGLDWKKFRLGILLGGDWIPTTLLNYFYDSIGDPEKGHSSKIATTMGLCESGKQMFFDNAKLSAIRRQAFVNPELRNVVFGEDDILPEVMHYFPDLFYLEIENPDKNGKGPLIVTALSDGSMPLIRYRTGDTARLMRLEELKQKLAEVGYKGGVPSFPLPVAFIYGRSVKKFTIGQKSVYIEIVKQILFEDYEIIPWITGQFRLTPDEKGLSLELQLSENVPDIREAKEALHLKFKPFILEGLEFKVYAQHDYPYGKHLDFERKFKYLAPRV